jgi:hypothetical protein
MTIASYNKPATMIIASQLPLPATISKSSIITIASNLTMIIFIYGHFHLNVVGSRHINLVFEMADTIKKTLPPCKADI